MRSFPIYTSRHIRLDFLSNSTLLTLKKWLPIAMIDDEACLTAECQSLR
jgi:hypothetical protein